MSCFLIYIFLLDWCFYYVSYTSNDCLHSIIFSFLYQHRYTLINDVLGYCYCYCFVFIASYLRIALSVYFLPPTMKREEIDDEIWNSPQFFDIPPYIFFFSSRFHNVCYCLLFIKKLFRSEEGSRVMRRKSFLLLLSYCILSSQKDECDGSFPGKFITQIKVAAAAE